MWVIFLFSVWLSMWDFLIYALPGIYWAPACARDSVVNSTTRARGSEGLRLVLGGKDCLCKPLSVVSC